MADLITRELIASSLYYASEEMGISLRNSSYSPNIKERMDHSAALFDSEGQLLAQAEHIPVHLGSLPWGLQNTIKYCDKERVDLEDGSMVVVNNPYIAGTHLNDVTVVKPIFFEERIVAFAANKAHHSDVGGLVPGSISANARSLFEEGFVINPMHLMRKEEFVPETLSILRSNSRTPIERIGDLKAQVAANVTGERRLIALIEKYGLEVFEECCKSSFEYSEELARKRIGSLLKDGTYSAVDYLEHPDGKSDLTLKVKIEIGNARVRIDYRGTDGQVSLPLNAVFGVTLSGVYYVLRAILGADVPPNRGAFAPISVSAPEGSLLNPTFPSPVAAGNVETSQRNADLLFKALSKACPNIVPAAAGGSMNNVMMGGVHEGKSWAFYETIGVGLGGSECSDGIDGIQANMTNTMNTPIEEIERSLPLLISRYEFREDSSGAGRNRGGSGLVRAFTMRSSSTVFTIVADRARHGPWGLKDGRSGATTEILSIDPRRVKKVPAKCTLNLIKGETMEIRTAGGGGYGNSSRRERDKVRADLESGVISRRYAKKCGYNVQQH